ncbi:hypothetical protein ILUMI_07245 [Ignelater luminosus]|uniref:Transmembrane protein 135 N-terminal domain-containing protein n=1 Tax=Ignelater luminosus TaxID=2038154 RepID=A0A8K0D7S9_IGNLU|nr:hypothetical protein ILUMI_07245 [Ignelater luminosus]
MVQIQSKLVPIRVTCTEYVHPWTDSCLEAISGCYLYAVMDSFRIYATVYVLALLMRGKIPTKEDVKRTVYGILQSTAFLSGTAFGYSLFLCSLRRLLGNFNLLTASGVPAFLASVFAILIERPSRRLLLSLYVSNVATETLWNMALVRNMVHPVKYGEIAMFSFCITTLLYYYKSGLHKTSEDDRSDSMFGVLRFVVGPYEEKDYTVRSSQASTFYRQHVAPNNPSTSRGSGGGSWSASSSSPRNTVYHLVMQALRVYKRLIYKIKCLDRHHACPHPFSCLYYTMQGAGKMFGVGLGIQVILKLILNMRRIIKSPKMTKTILFRKDILSLAAFLGGFSGVFRGLSCVLRRATGRDSPYYAIPAGLLAGIAFKQYPDTTVALYVLWKMAQITYNLGIDRGILPKVPGFTIFLYCFSTATLFHAALLEPTTLRPSYWKFLHSISGGRVACMNRNPLDVWGLETSQGLIKVLKQTNTEPVVQFYGGCTCS